MFGACFKSVSQTKIGFIYMKARSLVFFYYPFCIWDVSFTIFLYYVFWWLELYNFKVNKWRIRCSNFNHCIYNAISFFFFFSEYNAMSMLTKQYSHGLIYYLNISNFFFYCFTYINITVQLYKHTITSTQKKKNYYMNSKIKNKNKNFI